MARLARAALLAAAFLAACSRAEPPRRVVHDLARLAPAADRESPIEFVAFGTPSGARALVDGFVTPRESAEERYLWARPQVEMRVGGTPGAARRVALDLEPHPGARNESVKLVWNGQPVAQRRLDPARGLYVFDLPPASVSAAAPENRLRLKFRGAARHARPYGGRMAARLFSLASSAPKEVGLSRKERPPWSVETRNGLPVLAMAPGSAGFALRLPAGAELRFTPRKDADPAAALRLTLDDGRGPRELWRGAADAGKEVALPLAGAAGTPVLLTLHVDSKALTARAAWVAPRVMGSGPAAIHGSPQLTEADEARADALRQSLRGANAILVILDAAGAKHFGCYGQARPTTPEIDRIAGEGVVFENAYTPAVYTLPAMSSLLSSLEPDEHGNLDPKTGHLAFPPLVLAEALASRGIHTAGFVANGMVGRRRGFDRGFAEFHELYESAEDPTEAEDFRRVVPPFLQANQARRFFAWLHFREPHFPYDPKPPFDTLFGDGPITKPLRSTAALLLDIDHRRRKTTPDEISHLERLYEGNLAYVDRELGELRRRLEAQGLLEKTVLIISADHGEAFFEHGHIGHETQVYEELSHVPLVVRFPKNAGLAGRRVKGFVALHDLAATLVDAFGLWRDASTRPAFRGVSLLSVASGAPARASVTTRDHLANSRYARRDERSTCIFNTRADSVELYDRSADPGETRDLASSEPLRAALCRQEIAAWILERRPQGSIARAPELDPAQSENLRALGYVE